MRFVLKNFMLTVVILGASYSCAYAMGNVPMSMSKEMSGKAASNFKLDTLTQQGVDMTEYRAGKKAVIFFWATWCPHCREQIKELNAQSEAILQKGIKILLVDVGEETQEAQAYSQRNKIKLDIFLDRDSSVADNYRVIGVPTFYFLDEKGMIVSTGHVLPENIEEAYTK